MRAAVEAGHAPVNRQTPAVALREVTKTYTGGVRALDGVSLAVERGTFLAVMGPSGSGKSTLMHCAAGLDTPTGGSVSIDGTEIGGLNETRRAELRRERVGFVFQAYNLIPSLSIADNITLPLRLARRAPDQDWVRLLVERVGLSGRLERRPAELSGGQQQRAAIARALVTRPAVVFGDEPTGALDLRTAREVLDLLRDLVDGLGQTVVMVTHDPAAAARADRALVMADGRVVDTLEKPTAAELAHRITTFSPPDGSATGRPALETE
jgi:putative ABC transport system ATP-binding protein